MCCSIPVASRILGLKWYTFYSQVGTSAICSVIIIAIGCVVKAVLPSGSWPTFFMTCGVIGILGLGANMMIVLNREERQYLIDMVKRRVLRK